MGSEIGTVICTPDGPSSNEFSFVVTDHDREIPVRRGQFIELEGEEGKILAQVQDLIKTNRYFMRAESVKEYEKGGGSITSVFPADRWEHIVGRARTAGIQVDGGMKQATFPPSPGKKVYDANLELLSQFLGVDIDDGIELGKLQFHDLPAKLNLTKLLRKHVAILAMSGAGKCLSYESPVLLSSGELKPIGKLVDSAIDQYEKKATKDGIEYVLNPTDLSVFTLGEDLEIEENRVEAFMRRKFDDKLLMVKVRSGKELLLTPEHPLLTLEDGKSSWKPVGELGGGEVIAAPRRVRVSSNVQVVNLIESLQGRNDVSAFGTTKLLKKIFEKASHEGRTQKEIAKDVGVSPNGLRYWLKSGRIPLKKLEMLADLMDHRALSEVKYVGIKGSRPFKTKVAVDKDYARFLAYLFAEGHNNGEVLIFTNSDQELLNDFTKLAKKISGKDPYIRRKSSPKECRINLKTLAVILRESFGIKKSAAKKEIPNVILRSPNSVVKDYLRVLFDCDGYCSRDKPHLEITFSNSSNALKVQALLLRFGITSRIKTKKGKAKGGERSYRSLEVNGTDDLERFAENIGFCVTEKEEKLKNHLSLKPNPNIDLVPGVGKAINKLCRQLRISYSELARRAGVDQANISKYSKDGQSPSRKSLEKIAGALKDRFDELDQAIERLEALRESFPRTDPADLLNVFRNRRKREKLTFREISQNCCVSASTVGRMIRGTTAITDNVFDIARGVVRLCETPQNEPLTTTNKLAEIDKEVLLQEIQGLISSFRLNYAEVDKYVGFRSGTTRSYLEGERCPPYRKILSIIEGLGEFAHEINNGSESVTKEIRCLSTLATSDVMWDKITSIEEVEAPGYVYDLSVDGSHNFIAGNLVVHNSYCSTVLAEELLDRAKGKGRVASVVVDVHGEYTSLAKSSGGADYSDRVSVVRGENIKIGVPNMSVYQFREFMPDMSGSQMRELGRVLKKLRSEMRSGRGRYDLDDVIKKVSENGESSKNLRRALLDRLYDLSNLGIFGKNDYPNWRELAKPGEATILNLNGVLSLRKKQVILAYFARKLFNKRKSGLAPPFVIFMEEAHQFVPSKKSAISSSVLKTIAREGRKFYASLVLISQRPVRLSTTVLSQANTNIILRVTNPYDLDHIRKSSERITSDTIDLISSLPVGQALVVGEAVNHPVFIEVRKRRSKESEHTATLEKVAKSFEKSREKHRKDAEAFM